MTAAPAPTGNITVNVTVADSGAFAGTGQTGARTVTIGTGGTGTLTVSTVGDQTDEPNGTLTATVKTGTGYSAHGTNGSATVTVNDDDATPQVTLVLMPDSIGENGGTSIVTATLERASSAVTTVTVSAAASTDYGLTNNRILTIAAGATASSGTVRLTAVDNNVDAPDKTVTVSATAENSHGATAPANVTLTITDDDSAGVTVSERALTIAEGGSGSYTVVLDTQPSADVTIGISSDNTDVTLSAQTLTFTTSDWNSAQKVTVRTAQDADAVTDSATVTHMVSGGGYGTVSADSVTVTVTDDDTVSTGVTLSVNPATVGESAAVTEVTVTATLNGATRGSDTPVTVTVGSGTAVAGTDFGAVADFTITIAANSVSHTGTFNLTPTRDSVDEPDETVAVGGTAGLTVTSTQVTITDDDATPQVTLALDSDSISETAV